MTEANICPDRLSFFAMDVENLAATLAAASNGINATGDTEASARVMDAVAAALQRLSDAMEAEAEGTRSRRAA
ncbi:hypothetical protein [Rhodobaculum claviforme]|uniref:Uncharacterized protein n=1 Tax=Rhodobaculum claviforme TaxID=1549854 RepID=A0A934TKT8_9RHOB|nr:hypothetical protein [Rhodobaculum claviforme]MBK5927995.1 hypothetical protein [Rhodobaculum claviforme]